MTQPIAGYSITDMQCFVILAASQLAPDSVCTTRRGLENGFRSHFTLLRLMIRADTSLHRCFQSLFKSFHCLFEQPHVTVQTFPQIFQILLTGCQVAHDLTLQRVNV